MKKKDPEKAKIRAQKKKAEIRAVVSLCCTTMEAQVPEPEAAQRRITKGLKVNVQYKDHFSFIVL